MFVAPKSSEKALSEDTPLLLHQQSVLRCYSCSVTVMIQVVGLITLVYGVNRHLRALTYPLGLEQTSQALRNQSQTLQTSLRRPAHFQPWGQASTEQQARADQGSCLLPPPLVCSAEAVDRGAAVWLRSSEGLQTDGQGVVRWATRSGLLATRFPDGRPPVLIQIAGVPVLEFTGLDDGNTGMVVNNFHVPQPFTAIVVSNPGGDATIIANGKRDGPHFEVCHGFPLHGNPNPRVALVASGEGANPPDPPEQILHGKTRDLRAWHVYSAVVDGPSSELYVDGILEATGDPGPNGLTGLSIGADATGYFGLHGGLVELIIVPGRMTAVTREGLEKDLSEKYQPVFLDTWRSASDQPQKLAKKR